MRLSMIVREKAIDAVTKERKRTIRLFDRLNELLRGEITPESLDEASTLESELTGDCVASSIVGNALGLSAYADCDCWEAQDCELAARHLASCPLCPLKKS